METGELHLVRGVCQTCNIREPVVISGQYPVFRGAFDFLSYSHGALTLRRRSQNHP